MFEYDARCETCPYAQISRKSTGICACGEEYHHGMVPACPNVCLHDGKSVKKGETPTNVVLAEREEEKVALRQRYESVKQENPSSKLDKFEEYAKETQAFINVRAEILCKIASGESYGKRKPRSTMRVEWDTYLFGNCGIDVRYAALGKISVSEEESTNFTGLPSYGECCVVLKGDAIEKIASVSEENSKTLYKRHSQMFPMSPPYGYRAAWRDRAFFAVAKLGNHINDSTDELDFDKILLTPSFDKNRDEEEFIEVHLWGEQFSSEWIESVIVEKSQSLVEIDEPHRKARLGIVAEQNALKLLEVCQKNFKAKQVRILTWTTTD